MPISFTRNRQDRPHQLWESDMTWKVDSSERDLRRRAIGALVFMGAVSIGPVAQAQDTTRVYRFEQPYGGRVTCIVSQRGGVEDRSVTTSYGSSSHISRAPSSQEWEASGCAERIRRESRPISAEEQAMRLDAIRTPPTYEGPGGLRERLVELMCADTRNANSPECLAR